ncbi:hypothetical protein LUU34_00612700 [Aix galericulata]|nr:hypothetical protein LUU34_00612700 [Aix galericulata]
MAWWCRSVLGSRSEERKKYRVGGNCGCCRQRPFRGRPEAKRRPPAPCSAIVRVHSRMVSGHGGVLGWQGQQEDFGDSPAFSQRDEAAPGPGSSQPPRPKRGWDWGWAGQGVGEAGGTDRPTNRAADRRTDRPTDSGRSRC